MFFEGRIKNFFNLQILAPIFASLIFFNARKLVRSIIVFYITGILIGIFASFLIFGYIFQKLIPKVKFFIINIEINC
jgi:hypothetical protein